jgi:tRNA 5-methylaminomethyl-2-thiouridine biosynthesis bifunctional protein
LETSFGSGESFVHTLQAWQQDANAPPRLFFTALTADTPSHIHPLIADECFGLLPGVHRMVFEQGRVQLTLCIGPLPTISRDIDIAADSMRIDASNALGAKQATRLCKRGTAIVWAEAMTTQSDEWLQAGVQMSTATTGTFNPTWTPKSSLRSDLAHASSDAQHAVVIGAGLSGAATAYSLATRGWRVDVLDQGSELGAGASGLPAGIFATHVSPDNNVLSRITRDGVRATLHRAKLLLQEGKHWKLSQLLEHRYAGKRELPGGQQWPAAGHAWSTHASTTQKLAGGLDENAKALWHPLAGWIQTPEFVKAQLSHPNITWRGNCRVAQLQRVNSQWQALDEKGQCMAHSELLVLANAHACQNLLNSVVCSDNDNAATRPHLPATALRGQVTWGSMNALPERLRHALPTFPVNGHGSYIGHLTLPQADQKEQQWLVGSSFQRNDFDLTTRTEDLHSNMQQWAELMPALQEDIRHKIDTRTTHSWAAIRSALPDRVPAVGEFSHPDFKGLHVCTGMGARGISWSVLCGELLAAHIAHEPLPMAATLAKRMAASRFG